VIFEVDTEGHYVNSLNTASDLPTIGEDVFAIGNPKGLEQTLSKGIVSGYREANKYIQTTAEITNGSSGGPLFNMAGEVVGITTSGVGEANLNFAIKIQNLRLHNYL
jgi:serine protease Do